tara:strand:+ start:643 stop:894 length:252 start_codon:yes stop_codon:yes gene_type:complete
MDTELQKTYDSLQDIIEWDPSVVARGFKIRPLARYFGVEEERMKTMIKDLRNHLDEYVDDNDFCNYIQWCQPRKPYNHLGYEQ